MLEIKHEDIKLVQDWDGGIFLLIDENTTAERVLVLKSDFWTVGGIMKPNEVFHEGELEEVKGRLLLDLEGE